MSQHERGGLCDRAVERLNLPPTASYKDACYRVGEVMSQLLDALVELRFVAVRNTRLTGGTALRPDGTYVVYCATSRFWYHRLGILLHELAHVLLGHTPVALAAGQGLRRFAPHLPDKMIRLIAGRTDLTEDEEREAEELADAILERLTEQQQPDEPTLPDMAAHVMRIAEGLAHHPGWRDRDDL